MSSDVIAAWLEGSPNTLTLWPVKWREGLDDQRPPGAEAPWVVPPDDELRPSATAAPWVIVEAAVIRRPRRLSILSMAALMFGLGGVL